MSSFRSSGAELNCTRKRWSGKTWKEVHDSLLESKSVDVWGGKLSYVPPTFVGKQVNI